MDTQTTKSRLISKCLITDEETTKILDFGMHPYADTFISESQLNLSEPVFPLQVNMNPKSGQVQLGYISNDNDRYNLYSYSYTSSNSKFARNHWDKYFENIRSKYNLDNINVLEIGSNDGYLTEKFINKSNYVLGIDSSKTMCNIASSKGIDTISELFSSDLSNTLAFEFDIVIANNVFNHANDPIDFAKGVENILSNDGVFIFELPYWGSTIQSEKFDQIYHEHISYFTLKSSQTLLDRIGLKVVDCELVDYHGGSIRVYAKKSGEVSSRVLDFETMEKNLNLFDPETYKKFQKSILKKRNVFMKDLYELKSSGATIIGVGAAAKANTFLNYYNIDNSLLEYITDSSEHKQNKYTPLTRIPIVGDEIFANYDEVYALILSWNISDNLKTILKSINPKIKFITL